MVDAIDLFAGPGGWDVAARDLGMRAFGFEADPAACATRRASGLSTVAGDLRGYSGPYVGIPGRIASPPCQTSASAGWERASGFARITPEEAATLQTFPPDHQWRGTKTQVFQQIGNAVPPLLARAVLAEVTKP